MKYKIDYSRWQEAQKWEKDYWDNCIWKSKSLKNLNIFKTFIKNIISDGPDPNANHWWSKQFNDYDFIPRELQNVVEFGCGHTTNLRIILKGRCTKHVFASDPLVLHYITYRRSPLSKKWRSGEYLIDDHPLEETPFRSNYFDLVVCNNVLDHVRDISLCIENLVRVVKPGGILIFGQNLVNEEHLKATEELRNSLHGETGHPHTISSEAIFLPYFEEFDTFVYKILSREEGFAPLWHSGTFIYAGRKTEGIKPI